MIRDRRTSGNVLYDDEESWKHPILAFEGTNSPPDEHDLEHLRLGLVARLWPLVVGGLKT